MAILSLSIDIACCLQIFESEFLIVLLLIIPLMFLSVHKFGLSMLLLVQLFVKL